MTEQQFQDGWRKRGDNDYVDNHRREAWQHDGSIYIDEDFGTVSIPVNVVLSIIADNNQTPEAQARLLELERYKARDIESRRWRKQSEEPCPLATDAPIMYRDSECDGYIGMADFLTGDDDTQEWRYLSQDDMP